MCVSISSVSTEARSGAVLLVYNRPIPNDPVGHYERVEEGHPTPESALESIDRLPNPAVCWGYIETLQGVPLFEFGTPEF